MRTSDWSLRGGVTLADLYLAYRKAKLDAFFETTQAHAIAFTNYEKNLQRNLQSLLKVLEDGDEGHWSAELVGEALYIPKAIDDSNWQIANDIHFKALDPIQDWERRFKLNRGRKALARYRLLISPSVEFQIISALWILKVGALFDAKLDPRHVYGNRLRRSRASPGVNGEVNVDCAGLFVPYFSGYRKWRENGLHQIEVTLERDIPVAAITMDLTNYYHNISPRFLLRPTFLRSIGVRLSDDQRRLTEVLLGLMEVWYQDTPDFRSSRKQALPVGVSASKVIANVLLHRLDQQLVEKLNPIYYGRYVDDFFLVIERPEGVDSGGAFISWLSKSIPCLSFESNNGSSQLCVDFSYATDSEIYFGAAKQKIFLLDSKYGSQLIGQIRAKINEQSSEHRLLPLLPDETERMAARALLATPDAVLEADSLRKADAVSIRRLGLSLLIRDVEAYSRELVPSSWKRLRKRFYDLVVDQLITPKGIFDYYNYYDRILNVMVACNDVEDAIRFVSRLHLCMELIARTTSQRSTDRHKFSLSLAYFERQLLQSCLQATTTKSFRKWKAVRGIIENICTLSGSHGIPTGSSIRLLSRRMLLADWGTRPYKEFWVNSQERSADVVRIPRSISVRRILRLGGIRRFQEFAELKRPHWPALAFPTRPLSVADIGLVAPRVLEERLEFERAVWALRGAKIQQVPEYGIGPEVNGTVYMTVPTTLLDKRRVALTNFETTGEQWQKSVAGRPDRSLQRHRRTMSIVNRILRDQSHPNYIVFPEFSIPIAWAPRMATKLAQNHISFICGLEYRRTSGRLRNDSMVSLTTRLPWYPSSLIYLQPKLFPAHEEGRLIRKAKKKFYVPTPSPKNLPVYNHGGYYFGVIICSDLTNAVNRVHFQGELDTLFVLEHNRDVATFDFLIQATSHDINTFVVQANNRLYGDSRIRAPYKEEFRRDYVRIKGGITDYYVIDNIDYMPLREFQRMRRSPKDPLFKPVPIGFTMSERRRRNI